MSACWWSWDKVTRSLSHELQACFEHWADVTMLLSLCAGNDVCDTKDHLQLVNTTLSLCVWDLPPLTSPIVLGHSPESCSEPHESHHRWHNLHRCVTWWSGVLVWYSMLPQILHPKNVSSSDLEPYFTCEWATINLASHLQSQLLTMASS